MSRTLLIYQSNLVTYSGTANHSGLPNGTPIRTWMIGSAPDVLNNNGVTGDKLDNLSIIAP